MTELTNIEAESQKLAAEDQVIAAESGRITPENKEVVFEDTIPDNLPDIPDTPNMSLNGVRFISRKDSETSVGQKETTSAPYWTINDDVDSIDSVDAAAEADEESIASSLIAQRYPFLQPNNSESVSQQSAASSRERSVTSQVSNQGRESSLSNDGHISRAGSIVKETERTEIIPDKDMTYKVVTTKEKLTLETALPALDDVSKAILPSFDVPVTELTLDKIIQLIREIAFRYQKLPFFRYRLFTMAILSILFFILPGFITGLLFGLYLSVIAFLFICVSDPIVPSGVSPQAAEHVVSEVAEYSKKEEVMPKVYKGWMNILNEPYSPHTFHVNRIQTVLVRLDGHMLRISRPERNVLKHTFYDDPTLTKKEPTMMGQSIYDLTNASVKIRPKRLAKRRWFSRKYPICIRLASPDSEIHSRNDDRFFMSQSKTMNSLSKDRESSDGGSSPGPLKRLFRRKKKRSRNASEMSLASNASGRDSEAQSVHSSHGIEAMETRSADAKIQSDTTSAEVGKEADGYLSDLDLSDESEGDVVGVHRSFSAENLNRIPLIRLQKNFPGSKTRAFRNIYLFGRSAREKERWFHVLRRACNKYTESPNRPVRKSSLPSKAAASSGGMSRDYFLYLMDHLQFSKHLEDVIPKEIDSRSEQEKTDTGTIYMDLGRFKWKRPSHHSSSEFVIFANLMTTRLFYDFCRDDFFCGLVKAKIQNKLASIHLPYFIETLTLSKFELGTKIPKIERIYQPTVDDWGIWVDFDIHYEGCIRLVLETKADIMKLKENPDPSNTTNPNGEINATTVMSSTHKTVGHYSDEEVAESPETSPDEDYGSKVKMSEKTPKEKTGQKVLHMVDKVAHSTIFKKVAKLNPVKKAMEEISSTRLVLNVEITNLDGTLALNLPPPPSDRLWYGFRAAPQMCIKAVPQLGDRSVAFSTISDWIVGKIRLVLEKNLVLPNMDDIRIGVLGGNALINAPINQ